MVFGFSYLGSIFSLIWVAIMGLYWSGIVAKLLYAPLVTTVVDRLGFWQLGCENLSVLMVLHRVFGFWSNFFWFCNFGWIFSMVLHFLMTPVPSPPLLKRLLTVWNKFSPCMTRNVERKVWRVTILMSRCRELSVLPKITTTWQGKGLNQHLFTWSPACSALGHLWWQQQPVCVDNNEILSTILC